MQAYNASNYRLKYSHTCIYAYTYMYIKTYIQTYIHTYIHTHTSLVSQEYFPCIVAPITDSAVVATNAATILKSMPRGSNRPAQYAYNAITTLAATPVSFHVYKCI